MIDMVHHEARYLARLYRHMMKLLDVELAPLELGPGRYLYLFGLYIEDGRRQQELADTIGVDKAAAARALSRLEQDGYVRRRADPQDRRYMRVYLTPRGRHLQPQLEQAAAQCIDSMTSMLDSEERGQLRGLLAKMTAPILPAG